MTEAELITIEARANSATPGPWRRLVGMIEGKFNSVCHLALEVEVTADAKGRPIEDAFFIAHARMDVPKLVAEVRRLREELEEFHRRYGP